VGTVNDADYPDAGALLSSGNYPDAGALLSSDPTNIIWPFGPFLNGSFAIS
jgi:hypothetical protein